MKKIFCFFIVLTLMLSSMVTVFADNELSRQEIEAVLEKYDLEILPIDEVPEGLAPNDSIGSLEELEAAIIERLSMPKKIKITIDDSNTKNCSTEKSSTFATRASSGTTTEYKNVDSLNDLVLRYSVRAKYDTNLNNNKYWTEVISSDLDEAGATGWTRLNSIYSSEAEILSDMYTIEQTCDYELAHYVNFGGFWILTSTQDVNSMVRFSAKDI